jgi:hypothetical protein
MYLRFCLQAVAVCLCLLGLTVLSISKLEHVVMEIVAPGCTIDQHTARLCCCRICISIRSMLASRLERKQVIVVHKA